MVVCCFCLESDFNPSLKEAFVTLYGKSQAILMEVMSSDDSTCRIMLKYLEIPEDILSSDVKLEERLFIQYYHFCTAALHELSGMGFHQRPRRHRSQYKNNSESIRNTVQEPSQSGAPVTAAQF
ncbi:UNVERIFIED_CONTAM: hypothetical protein FKN15_044859 [Acipenser sinensis]